MPHVKSEYETLLKLVAKDVIYDSLCTRNWKIV